LSDVFVADVAVHKRERGLCAQAFYELRGRGNGGRKEGFREILSELSDADGLDWQAREHGYLQVFVRENLGEKGDQGSVGSVIEELEER